MKKNTRIYKKPQVKVKKLRLNFFTRFKVNSFYEDMLLAAKCCGTCWSCSSDIRLKKNIKKLGKVLPKIQHIQGYTFNWRPEFISKQHSLQPQIGLIAQEVERVFPELVLQKSSIGFKAIDYGKFTAVLVEAVKELKKNNDRLEKRLNLVEKKLKNHS